MVKKHKILEVRERLDKTLTSPGLANENSIKSLIRKQLLLSPFSGTEGDLMNIVEKRSGEVSNFIGMLRSASSSDKAACRNSHSEWKIKQDTDQLRVMYREGPQGSPFHTLLAEGYADGPIDVCSCVSMEATLYKKWWPQYNIPAFKIIMSTCVQKVRIGEEISLVRVKVPWPMSDREALLHFFELEYFEEDLLLVLINTIPEGERIDLSTNGFTKDGIPENKDSVRINLVGGFVLQKINPTRCYFRAIASMDIKLDFVPPSLINFISRQLIGNGHKLYQKAVASVATTDEDYREALKGQMYVRAREGVDPFYKPKTMLEGIEDEEKSVAFLVEEYKEGKSTTNTQAMDNPQVSEIEEEEHNFYLDANQITSDSQTRETPVHKHQNKISSEVENALNVLDEAIAIFRDLGSPDGNQIQGLPSHLELQIPVCVQKTVSLNGRDEPQSLELVKPPCEAIDCPVIEKFRNGEVGPIGRQPSNHDQDVSFLSPNEGIGLDKDRSRTSSTERPTDAIATGSRLMALPHEEPTNANITRSEQPTLDQKSRVFDEVSAEVNGARGSGRYEAIHMKKKKKQRFCCLSFN
uniref:Uncharacterized protein n=1 Tax=Anthurium amnicola TaxID=1678845 RepID=A0A1D1ZIQ6_9ARAE